MPLQIKMNEICQSPWLELVCLVWPYLTSVPSWLVMTGGPLTNALGISSNISHFFSFLSTIAEILRLNHLKKLKLLTFVYRLIIILRWNVKLADIWRIDYDSAALQTVESITRWKFCKQFWRQDQLSMRYCAIYNSERLPWRTSMILDLW